MFKLILFIL